MAASDGIAVGRPSAPGIAASVIPDEEQRKAAHAEGAARLEFPASGRQLPWAPQEDAKIPCCSVNAAASGGFRGYPQRKKGTRITSQESALPPTIKNSLFLGDQRSSFAVSG